MTCVPCVCACKGAHEYSMHMYIEQYDDRGIHILTRCTVECTDVNASVGTDCHSITFALS